MHGHGCALWGLTLLLWGAVMTPSSADAAGYGRWDLPSNLAQYFGYGFGPGYHAPRIRVAPTPAAVVVGDFRTRPVWLGASYPVPVGVGAAPVRASAAAPWSTSWPAAGAGGTSLVPVEARPQGRVEPLPTPQATPPQR